MPKSAFRPAQKSHSLKSSSNSRNSPPAILETYSIIIWINPFQPVREVSGIILEIRYALQRPLLPSHVPAADPAEEGAEGLIFSAARAVFHFEVWFAGLFCCICFGFKKLVAGTKEKQLKGGDFILS
jgi:hypothetical protein